jgi:1-aminocyclopropane-1-carboxylate deaminase
MMPVRARQLEGSGVSLWIKREDLIHPWVSGNKWRKLKYNIQEAQNQGFKKVFTFGGAYSNHIFATGGAGKLFGINTVGIIRGDELTPDSSPTLRFAHDCDMELIFVSRTDYRNKQLLAKRFGEGCFVIPEGGSNTLALLGLNEMMTEVYSQLKPTHIACAVGTGGTLAGIVAASHPETEVMGFAALNGSFLKGEIQKLIPECQKDFKIFDNYTFGGYAKTTPQLMDFIRDFESQNPDIQLEQVYTAKMFYGLFDLIQQGYFPNNSTVLAIHTGGLQGRNIN